MHQKTPLRVGKGLPRLALCAVLLALGCAVPAFAAEKTTYTIEEMKKLRNNR